MFYIKGSLKQSTFNLFPLNVAQLVFSPSLIFRPYKWVFIKHLNVSILVEHIVANFSAFIIPQQRLERSSKEK